MSWSLEVTFPEPYQTLQAFASVIMDFSIVGLLPIECLVGLSYHSHVLVVTLVPLLLVITCVVAYKITSGTKTTPYKISADDNISVDGKNGEKIQFMGLSSGTYLQAALMVSFLTLPTSSTALFRTFHCKTFDDNSRYLISGEEDGSVLARDLAI